MYSESHRAEKQREASRRYRERHAVELAVERVRVRQTGELQEYWRAKTAKWRKQNGESARACDKRYYANAKERAFGILGGKCARCGETDVVVLQIDHIDAIGDAERRRQNHRGIKLYRAVVKHPEKFQLLCANDNWRKRHALGEQNRRLE